MTTGAMERVSSLKKTASPSASPRRDEPSTTTSTMERVSSLKKTASPRRDVRDVAPEDEASPERSLDTRVCEWMEDMLRAERRAVESELSRRHEEVLSSLARRLQGVQATSSPSQSWVSRFNHFENERLSNGDCDSGSRASTKPSVLFSPQGSAAPLPVEAEPPAPVVAQPPDGEAPSLQTETRHSKQSLISQEGQGCKLSLSIPEMTSTPTGSPEESIGVELAMKPDQSRTSGPSQAGSAVSEGSKKLLEEKSCDGERRKESFDVSTNGSGASDVGSDEKPSRLQARRKSNKLAKGFDQVVLKKGAGSTKNYLKRLVLNPRFELFFAALILLNTVIMGLEAQYSGMEVAFEIGYTDKTSSEVRPANVLWPGASTVWEVAEWVFGVLFTLELLLKLLGLRRTFIKDGWNLFDSIIVACWIISILEAVQLPINPTILRLTRLVRLLRLLRLVKTIQGFDSLYLMTASIRSSMSALGWSAVLLFIVELMMALILQVILEGYITDVSIPENDRYTVYTYFGTFSRSLLTMFEMMFGNWYTVTRVLVSHVSEWYMICGVAHQLVLGFAVVEVITGIFFHETFKVASMDDAIMMAQKNRQNLVHEEKMNLLFEHADEDYSGTLDRDEFRKILGNKEVQTWLAAMDLDASDVDTVFSLLHDDNMEVTAKTLVEGVARLKGPARSIDLSNMMRKMEELEARLDKRIEREFVNSRRMMTATPSTASRRSPRDGPSREPSPDVSPGSPFYRRSSTEGGPRQLAQLGALHPASPPAISPRPGGLKKNASVCFVETAPTPERIAKVTRTFGKYARPPKPALVVQGGGSPTSLPGALTKLDDTDTAEAED